MKRNRPYIFVDSNVLIEGLFLKWEAATAVVSLAANEQLALVTCKAAVVDVEDEILERCTEANDLALIDDWKQFLDTIKLEVVPDPPKSLVREVYTKYMGIMRHEADIPILASAIEIRPTLILSSNTEHWNIAVSERCGIPIMTCNDYLAGFMQTKETQEMIEHSPK